MKNYVIVSLILFLIGICCFAQSNEVKLVVSSDGPTKEEATKNALRSAIEQAYGTFVSANTEILNDELVRDEIVTVSSGNIKSYQEISSMALPKGGYSVSLSTVVSIGKLVSYAQSKGAKAELAGQTFAMNMRMRELNKKNELLAIHDMVNSIKDRVLNMYDYDLRMYEPFKQNEEYVLPVSVLLKRNANYQSALNQVIATFRSLSLSESEKQAWESNGMYVTTFTYSRNEDKVTTFYLRNDAREIQKELLNIEYFLSSSALAWKLIINDIYCYRFPSYEEYRGYIRELTGKDIQLQIDGGLFGRVNTLANVHRSITKADPFDALESVGSLVSTARYGAGQSTELFMNQIDFFDKGGMEIFDRKRSNFSKDIEEKWNIFIQLTSDEMMKFRSVAVAPINHPSRSTENETLKNQYSSGPGNDNDIVDNAHVKATNTISFNDVAKKPSARGYKTDTMLTLLRDGTTFYCYGTDSESIHVDFVVDESGKVSDITYGAGVPDRAKDSIRQLIQWLKWSPGIDAAGNPVPVRIDIDTSKSAMSSKKMMEYSKFAHSAKLPGL